MPRKQGSFWENLWQAFNPLSVQVGLVYGVLALAAVNDHDYTAITKLEHSDEHSSEQVAA